MHANPATVAPSKAIQWARQARVVIGVALLWAALEFVVSGLLYDRGIHRPIVLMRLSTVPAALVIVLLAAAGGYLGRWVGLRGGADHTEGLSIVLYALALWIWPSGTMDDWLMLANPVPGSPSGAAYASLLADYFYMGVVILAAWVAGLLSLKGGPARLNIEAAFVRQASPGASQPEKPLPGWAALFVTSGIALALLLILTGPRTDVTRRGQVYFALILGFYVAGWAAMRLTHVRSTAWYLPAPFIVGLAGLLWATLQPGLPGRYAHINIIPANGLVRALPVEMISVGVATLLVLLRTADRHAAQHAGAAQPGSTVRSGAASA